MKKIVVVNNNLNLGGIQKSLIEFLKLVSNKYEITLVLFEKGLLLSEVPSNVKVIQLDFPIKQLGISHKEAKTYGKGLQSLILRGWTRLFGKKLIIKYILNKTSKLEGEYDFGISYSQNTRDNYLYASTNEYVLSKINAKTKITYMHGDFAQCGSNTPYNRKIMGQFDKIVAVSQYCANKIIEKAPELQEKIVVIQNAVDYERIRELSRQDPVEYSKEYFNVVTVARLSQEKGLLRAIKIIHDLLNDGMKIKYHVIGEGPQREEIEEYISQNGITDNVVLYGAQINPYRYMLNADLFLLPSYQESAGIVLQEALGIGVPVLSTNVGSAEQLISSKYGVVCSNSDIKESLVNILDFKILKELKENLSNIKLDNNEIVDAVSELFDEK